MWAPVPECLDMDTGYLNRNRGRVRRCLDIDTGCLDVDTGAQMWTPVPRCRVLPPKTCAVRVDVSIN